eukprot:379559-Hanusia_phi.AAC.1
MTSRYYCPGEPEILPPTPSSPAGVTQMQLYSSRGRGRKKSAPPFAAWPLTSPLLHLTPPPTVFTPYELPPPCS